MSRRKRLKRQSCASLMMTTLLKLHGVQQVIRLKTWLEIPVTSTMAIQVAKDNSEDISVSTNWILMTQPKICRRRARIRWMTSGLWMSRMLKNRLRTMLYNWPRMLLSTLLRVLQIPLAILPMKISVLLYPLEKNTRMLVMIVECFRDRSVM